MIRIDEIYDKTFWPWIKKHLPLTRMFFCDPPGRSDVDSLFNYGDNVTELHYIMFHDQEPIHLDIHNPLFDSVEQRNLDLDHSSRTVLKALVTSEWNSEFVEKTCANYGWYPFYYFFHGWASLDWYRGYDKTFVIQPPMERNITRSFISPNRIIGGLRDHRILLMYRLLKERVQNAWISFPSKCPVENIDIEELSARYQTRHPDIVDVFSRADLPLCFPGETDHPMHSCWLSLFDECAESLAFVVTETVYSGRRNHLTEKTFKPICLRMPFIMVSTAHSLEYLRKYGFKTFGNLWDESYDNETDDDARLDKISKILIDLDRMTVEELQNLYRRAIPIIEHNYRHFYEGGFESILWLELQQMFQEMRSRWGSYAN